MLLPLNRLRQRGEYVAGVYRQQDFMNGLKIMMDADKTASCVLEDSKREKRCSFVECINCVFLYHYVR